MRCRDKLAIERYDRINKESDGGCMCCPHTYGYLDKPDYCFPSGDEERCTECWDREIPGTLPTNKYEDLYVGCDKCEYWDTEDGKEPCVYCRHNSPFTGDRYWNTPSFYKPEDMEPYGGEPKEDVINHPNHYTNSGMECIDEMETVFGIVPTMHFCLLNVWKYRKRAIHKNGEEDLKKSDWYMNKYKELQEKLYGKESV